MTAACHGHRAGTIHPIVLEPDLAEWFTVLRADMAAEGQPWKRATYTLLPDGRFDLDFEYD